MVFRGRPSKACQRCRERRLKCDLFPNSCGQCLRAGVVCSGYRDTKQLRIRNESQAVRLKALSKWSPPTEPLSLILPLEFQAREAFFAHHVTGPAKTWSFLLPFYDQIELPEHLNLTIDAVSLAHFSHEVCSEAALATAKKKYVSALHMTNKALRSPSMAAEDTTLVTSLLLDLFEKITNIEARHIKSWSSHLNGALALVGLRGLDQFVDFANIRVLVRLSTNLLISCVASETHVPRELIGIRSYAAKFLDAEDPKWKLSDLMIEFANLRSDIRTGKITTEDIIYASLDLDSKLEVHALNMPPSWQYQTKFVETDSEDSYSKHFDVYPGRHVTQTWNVLRLVRIRLNEMVLEHCVVSSPSFLNPSTTINAKRKIECLASEICSSILQYTDCLEAYQSSTQSTPESTTSSDSNLHRMQHHHTPSQNVDCCTLIFPLYVAGRSPSSAKVIKPWVIKKLHHIADHFGIRNAELVAQILENGADVDPWTVYAMLGSYAFAA